MTRSAVMSSKQVSTKTTVSRLSVVVIVGGVVVLALVLWCASVTTAGHGGGAPGPVGAVFTQFDDGAVGVDV